MQSNPIISSPIFSFNPFSYRPKHSFYHPRRASTRIFAHDQNYHSGRLVDENMIVLRKRIHEMKLVERNFEPPSDWMDWEKRYYTSYDSLICEIMGILQSQLMNTRPSLAFGMMALIILSVPTSTGVVLFHLLEIAKGFMAGISA